MGGWLGDLVGSIFGFDDGGSSGPSLLEQHWSQSQSDMSGMFEQMISGFAGMFEQMSLAQAQMMSQQMSMMSQFAASSMLQPPELIPLPQVAEAPKIDFTKMTDQLSQQAKGQFSAEDARRKGLAATVHTGSLLDDEDPSVTGSPLVARK